jgi:hypothetical protein
LLSLSKSNTLGLYGPVTLPDAIAVINDEGFSIWTFICVTAIFAVSGNQVLNERIPQFKFYENELLDFFCWKLRLFIASNTQSFASIQDSKFIIDYGVTASQTKIDSLFRQGDEDFDMVDKWFDPNPSNS